jgi:uncharacterized protein YgiM (DUF1202 family)
MNLLQIKQTVGRLSLTQLRRLDGWLHEVIQKAEESTQAAQPQARKQIVEERTVENQTYRLEMVRCGKEKCKCSRGELHGPYWYSYTRVNGKVKSQYVGKRLPTEIGKPIS